MLVPSTTIGQGGMGQPGVVSCPFLFFSPDMAAQGYLIDGIRYEMVLVWSHAHL